MRVVSAPHVLYQQQISMLSSDAVMGRWYACAGARDVTCIVYAHADIAAASSMPLFSDASFSRVAVASRT